MLTHDAPARRQFRHGLLQRGHRLRGELLATAATVTVSQASTTLGLGSSDDPSTLGQPVTHHGERVPVHGLRGDRHRHLLRYDGAVIGSGNVSNGQATLTTATLPVGTDSVTATYGGRRQLHRQRHPGARGPRRSIPRRPECARRRTEIKQGNPCYIDPEERTRRSEGWAAMSVAIVTGASGDSGRRWRPGWPKAGWSLVVDGRDRGDTRRGGRPDPRPTRQRAHAWSWR